MIIAQIKIICSIKNCIYVRNNSLLHGLTELRLRDLLHFREDHSRDFLGSESFLLAEVRDFDHRRSILINDLEWPVGHILIERSHDNQ